MILQRSDCAAFSIEEYFVFALEWPILGDLPQFLLADLELFLWLLLLLLRF
jgi:hypothetical protein